MKKKVLVIGDIIIDKYIHVETERTSQESSDVPVYDILCDEVRLGGAGNVAANIAALDADIDVYLCGIVASRYIELIEGSGVTPWMCVYGQSLLKNRYYSGHKLISRVDDGRKFCVWYRDAIEQRLTSRTGIDSFDAVVVSDYDKGTCDFIASYSDMFSNVDIVVIDSKRENLSMFENTRHFLNINEEEYSKQVSFNKDAPVERKFKSVIVTLGDRGAELLTYGGEKAEGSSTSSVTFGVCDSRHITHSEIFSIDKLDPVDVTGCGDTHTAAFTVALLRDKKDVRNAVRFANQCAGIAVQRFGTTKVTRWDFLKSLEE